MRSLLGQRAAVCSTLAVNEAVAVHANHQHIHVVETPARDIRNQPCLLFDDAFDRRPAVLDVMCGAPEVRARGLDPLLRFLHAPRAGAEHDVPAAVCQCRTHAAIEIFPRQHSRMVAEIVFQIVHAPSRKGFGIDILMRIASGVRPAGQVAATGVNTEFQPFGVDVINHGLDAVRELLPVGNQSARAVADLFGPSVINHYVTVARLGKPRIHKKVCRFTEQAIADIRSEGVPRIPPERRCILYHVFYPLFCIFSVDDFVKSCITQQALGKIRGLAGQSFNQPQR